MLTELLFKSGSNPQQPHLELQLSPVTIFVGPNNGGKSRALMEIEAWIKQSSPIEGQVIDKVVFESWTIQDIDSEISKIKVESDLTELVALDHIVVSKLNPQDNNVVRLQLHLPGLKNEALKPNEKYRGTYSRFLSLYTLRLDGKNR